MLLRLTRSCIGLVIVVVGSLGLVATAPAAHRPAATAARTCSVPDYPGSGYFTSLSVSRTSCATGRKVALAWYHCRIAHGPAGRCHRRVLGYTCHETRQSIPTEIDARVRCRRGARRVTHTYQQDT
jgi:hypothetical protein